MTKVVSVVRLIPADHVDVGFREYCVQLLIPELGTTWRNIGNIFLDESGYAWRPIGSCLNLLPDIEVTAADLYSDFSNRFDPYLFARYRMKKIVDELMSGELPPDEIVPRVFSKVDSADLPVFIGHGPRVT